MISKIVILVTLFSVDLATGQTLHENQKKSPPFCGCESCTEDVLNKKAGRRSCKDRINRLQFKRGFSERRACVKIAGKRFKDICGPFCDPQKCKMLPTTSPATQDPTPSPTPIPTPTFTSVPSKSPVISNSSSSCGCRSCTQDVLNRMAGEYSCKDRINWLQFVQGYSEDRACEKVAGDEFPGICGPCNPKRCNLPPTPVTPEPTYVSAPPSPLYCFPPESSRVTFQNVWGKYTVQVKQDNVPCGPGNNIF